MLFGKVSGNLPECEKNQPESNEDSIPHCLSDSQCHTAPVHRRDREGPQGPEPHLLAEEPRRGNALLPGVEDRVAQLELRRRTGERRPLALDGRDSADAEHIRERQCAQACRHGEGPVLEGVQPPHGHRAGVRQGSPQGLLLPHQGADVRRRLVHHQAHDEQLRLGSAPTREGRREAAPDIRPRKPASVLRRRRGRRAPRFRKGRGADRAPEERRHRRRGPRLHAPTRTSRS